MPRHAAETTDSQDFRLLSLSLCPGDYLNARWGRSWRPLGAVLHGGFEPPERDWPQVSSPFQPLDGLNRAEVFLTPEPARRLPHPLFSASATQDLLFATYTDPGEAPMAAQAEMIYDELLSLVENAGFPHLLRIWHAIPRIHDNEDGLERYRQFNVGRTKAYARHGSGPPSRFPAASVLGAGQGGIHLFAIAAKAPGLTIENPNQVSAYRYPPIHGPSSPSFSRALVSGVAGKNLLFLSGTASITGHETRHVGKFEAQVRQTLDNLDALIDRAGAASGTRFVMKAGKARLRAYVRERGDYETARTCVEARLGHEVEVLYLQADICRRNLLFEMDGMIAP